MLQGGLRRAGARFVARARWLVALGSVVAALGAAAPATAVEPSYVALGDSFTAGPVIPLQIPPFGCLKSNNNYPHMVHRRLEDPPGFRDVSCSGAQTKHMTQPQNVWPDGPNPPQLNALHPETRLVTLGIGGNDIGFSEIIENCGSATSPQGSPCQDHYVQNGRDEITERIKATAPKIAAVIQAIHARSPEAKVAVVNYLPILPHKGPGCWPQMPVADADVPYLRAKHKELNDMLAEQAKLNDAKLVNAYKAGIGHDACKPPVVRWVEPAVPVHAAAPFHPNLGGMIGTAEEVLSVAR
jgi:lysophospholipase L1-like esterase